MNSRQTDAKTTSPLLALVLVATLTLAAASYKAASVRLPGGAEMTLWYRQPAQQWTEALPIGNTHR